MKADFAGPYHLSSYFNGIVSGVDLCFLLFSSQLEIATLFNSLFMQSHFWYWGFKAVKEQKCEEIITFWSVWFKILLQKQF